LQLNALKRSSALGAAAAVFGLSASTPLDAQVADVAVRTTFFHEPSSTSKMTVLNPALSVGVRPAEWLGLEAGYEADIVTGASESIKGGALAAVDVVSSATSFTETRHVARFGFDVTRDAARLAAAYAYGTESDYRSHSISVSAATDFLQKNTTLELSYARGFDEVCTSAFGVSDAPSIRLPLDASSGCFSDDEDRAAREVSLDSFQAGWTQAWTPVLVTQAVVTAGLQHGFLENPYRAVVLAPAGDQALENHPDNRARAALALGGRYYVRPVKTAFGLRLRGYRDTWDILSLTAEASGEYYVFPWLRLLIRGRYYAQSGALFWSDDYTGGEPATGPRGQYWSGDRELSPLRSYLVGGRVLAVWQGSETRVAGMFTRLSLGVSLDLMQTDLKDFTWAGRSPDDTRAIVLSPSLNGDF
jgi:hypothetical protein